MKKNLPFVICTPLVMVGLPWLAVTFGKGDAGMALCFLLFFAVDPLYAGLTGFLAGRSAKTCWFQPFVTPLFFLLGTWLLFAPGEPAFLLYAAAYLVLGCLTMGITLLWNRRK